MHVGTKSPAEVLGKIADDLNATVAPAIAAQFVCWIATPANRSKAVADYIFKRGVHRIEQAQGFKWSLLA